MSRGAAFLEPQVDEPPGLDGDDASPAARAGVERRQTVAAAGGNCRQAVAEARCVPKPGLATAAGAGRLSVALHSTHAAHRAAGLPSAPAGTPATRLPRPVRVLLLLLGVWLLNIFDLGFTLHQAPMSHFIELNPLAARLLDAPPVALVLYKFSLLGTGTLILLALRRYAVAELACWFLLAVYFYVAVRWYAYYYHLLQRARDGLLIFEP